ncbi:MAG: AAA family ATPase [Deltaproteobacteria bacterium]|jgi:hypothetical protein|nr:AAA family ATPase [Deltaproteobacteria bacterium]
MVQIKKLPCNINSFETIITNNHVYVDKTAYLAKMIADGGKAFLLLRPRRFGKSLIVSTLISLFSGNKDLFKGLAIEKFLRKEPFAPRPVIHLDLAAAAASQGLDGFGGSLGRQMATVADELNVPVNLDLAPSEILWELIAGTARKYGEQVAVLIDDYDTPVTDLWDKPTEADKVRKTLGRYFTTLKALDNYTSFVLLTGVTKAVLGGPYSAFDTVTDISLDPGYGALTGFTHEELTHHFKAHIDKTAERRETSPEALLEGMGRHYHGYCFDNETLLYNPHSTLSFFDYKTFDDFWFSASAPDKLVSFLNEMGFMPNQFRFATVPSLLMDSPDVSRFESTDVLLFRMGYLSLKPTRDEKPPLSRDPDYLLDYPNALSRTSMAQRFLLSYFPSADETDDVIRQTQSALTEGDHLSLIDVFDLLIHKISLVYYVRDRKEVPYYRDLFLTLFYAMNLDPTADERGPLGESELLIRYGARTWFVGLTVTHGKRTVDRKHASDTLKQLLAKDLAARYENPLTLALTVNDYHGEISGWARHDERGRSLSPQHG